MLYKIALKRVLDVVFAIVILLLSFPILAVIAVLVRLDSPGGAIFRQVRLGRGGRPFTMLKFRTMRAYSEHEGSGVYSGERDDRVTRVGRFLRRTSLDELPQLWNILRGDMSFIGPRPPLTYHPWPLSAYTDEQRRMFEVRPGLSGWAQINGRRTVLWPERIRMNVWYIDHLSPWLDIRILICTVGRVLSKRDNENLAKTAPDRDLSRLP